MPQARGVDISAALYEETTFATDPATPTGLRMYLTKWGMVPNQNLIDSATLNAERSRSQPARGNIDVAGVLSAELASEWMGTPLKHLIGDAVVTTGMGPYTHVLEIADLPVGMVLEKDNGPNISGSGRFEKFNGCKWGRGDFTFPTEGFCTVDLSAKGAKYAIAAATIDDDDDLLDLGHTPWESREITAILEGGGSIATVQDVKISLDNGLDDTVYVIGGQGSRRSLPEGFATITGSLTALFEGPSLLSKAIAGTETSLKITLSRGTGLGSAGNEFMEFELAQMKYELAGVPVDGPRGLVTPLNFKGYRKLTNRGFKLTIKNAVATI